MKFHAYAAREQGGTFEPFEYDPGDLRDNEVQVKVEHCGICHSDLSVLHNEWGNASYPFVPGHEVVGIIEELGPQVKHLKAGQRVGVGWFSGSCMTCDACMSGDHNLCNHAQEIMLGRHGGFADRVRVNAEWASVLPPGVNPETAGPLFCGGITVFNPIIQADVKATDRVGVIGIGGLGHMALQLLRAWGCEVTAFSSTPAKEEVARRYGAHHFVSSHDDGAVAKLAGSLDFILVTANVPLDWPTYLDALAPRGRLHFVGAVTEPVGVPVFSLLVKQKVVSATPLGSPATIRRMLQFCARHQIEPTTKNYTFDQVNEAFAELREKKPACRLVLKHA